MEPGQYSFSAQHGATGLAHLSYHCPGLHGPGAAQTDVRRLSFRSLLGNGRPVMRIPPFQRAYCWDEKLAETFWRDSKKTSHSLGKVILSPAAGVETDAEMLVIDGQQRLTTLCLLVTVIRDAVLTSSEELTPQTSTIVAQVASACNAVLFSDEQASSAWCRDARAKINAASGTWEDALIDPTSALPFLSLVPSLRDRSVYLQMIAGGLLGLVPTAHDCPMARVKRTFDSLVHGRNVKLLAGDLRRVLDSMNVMIVTIIKPPAGLAQQVLSMGAGA